MPKTEIEHPVRLSVLDRLIDSESSGATGESARERSVAQLKAALRRDLEWLLNTRRLRGVALEHRDELRRSLYQYGLPDISSISRDSAQELMALLHQIEETIATFEPRLQGVRVSMGDGRLEDTRQLHFVIEGLLRIEPVAERVVFDTVLEVFNGEYRVEADDHAR